MRKADWETAMRFFYKPLKVRPLFTSRNQYKTSGGTVARAYNVSIKAVKSRRFFPSKLVRDNRLPGWFTETAHGTGRTRFKTRKDSPCTKGRAREIIGGTGFRDEFERPLSKQLIFPPMGQSSLFGSEIARSLPLTWTKSCPCGGDNFADGEYLFCLTHWRGSYSRYSREQFIH